MSALMYILNNSYLKVSPTDKIIHVSTVTNKIKMSAN